MVKIATNTAVPIFQLDKVKLFCPYGDSLIISPDCLRILHELCIFCQKSFVELAPSGGLLSMFDTSLQQHHLDRMVQNVITTRQEDVLLKFECFMGDMELSCDSFILSDGKLSFDLTDYLVIVIDLCSYSVYLTDVAYLYSALCKRIEQVQEKFADKICKFFIQEVNFFSGKEPMGLCCFNE